MIQGGHFSASKGGAQYQAEVLVDQLVQDGAFDVTYITRQADPNFTPKGYNIELISTPKLIRRRGFWLDAIDLYTRLRRIRPDVIYQQGLRGHTGIAAWCAKRSGAKFVFHIASDFDVLPSEELARVDFAEGTRIDKAWGEYGLRHADAVIAQTTVQNELLKTHYGRTADLIVRNFHPPASTTTNHSTNSPRVIWVANFKEVKRPELFVDLAESLQDSQATFVMIGRPGDSKLYRNLHQRIDALSNLIYLGEMSQDAVNAEIEQSHILVNTSLFEGFPNTFIQAWMRGLPVITQGLNTDGLFDSQTIGICSANFDGMKQAVFGLIANEARREQMGSSAISYAESNHSMKVIQPLIETLRYQR